MASPLNPTSRTRSYQETATSNLRKILKKFLRPRNNKKTTRDYKKFK